MSFIDQEILKSFVSDNHYLVKTLDPTGLEEAISQVDDIIYQKTGIAAPEDPESAPPVLRNIACSLLVWFTTGQSESISESEYERRVKLYDDAMTKLDAYENGDEKIIDADGDPVNPTTSPSGWHSNPSRLTEPL